MSTRRWRTAQFDRFAKRQQKLRKWINFAEIAEWCSEEESILPNEDKRARAFDLLASDLLAGVFEENGRSLVLFLHPTLNPTRMTREWLKEAIDHSLDGHHGRSYLAHCWIPRRLFERWLARHRLPESPPRFEPLGEQSVQLKQQSRKKRRPSFERAQVAIKALYPNAVPDQAIEPNASLCRRVSKKLKELELPDVSDDTILRAAGRRK